jgi:flagellar motility protein MotE (MotC chaperone)
MTTGEFILTLLASLLGSGAVSALVTAMFNRRKTTAEARKSHAEARKTEADCAQQLSETAVSLINPLKEQIAMQQKQLDEQVERIDAQDTKILKLERQNRRYLARIEELTGGIMELLQQMAEAKIAPRWTPREWVDE